VKACPACGRPQGSNAECLSCRDAAAKELAAEARDVTNETVAEQAEAARRFLERPPWYARVAPRGLRPKLRLLGMVADDCVHRRYPRMPWGALLTVVAAIAYVVSPLDLIPDILIPAGWTDDLLVLAAAWGMVKRELKAYCTWKGLSPTHFNL
jgi:uncharacterized membrane protein YkvA (DUF1232 family)